MDANENVWSGDLAQQLRQEGLDMEEAVHSQMPGRAGPKTWFRGTESIDGIWATDDIEVIAASYLPFDAHVGDHRLVIVDFSMKSVLGTNLKRIIPLKARRLNSKIPRLRNAYNNRLEDLCSEHRILPKIQQLQQEATYPATWAEKDAMEKLDNVLEQFMTNSEQKCRHFYIGQFEYSPEIQAWVDKCHAYKWLIRFRTGQRVNIGNMKRFARRNGITKPQCLMLPQLIMD